MSQPESYYIADHGVFDDISANAQTINYINAVVNISTPAVTTNKVTSNYINSVVNIVSPLITVNAIAVNYTNSAVNIVTPLVTTNAVATNYINSAVNVVTPLVTTNSITTNYINSAVNVVSPLVTVNAVTSNYINSTVNIVTPLLSGNAVAANFINIAVNLNSANSIFSESMLLIGNALRWKDDFTDGFSLGSAVAAPTTVNFQGNIQILAFDGTSQTDRYSGRFELQHDWKEGSNVEAHIHWTPVNSANGNVKFYFEYTWKDVTGQFATPATINVVKDITTANVNEHIKSSFGTIDATGYHIDSAMLFQIYRVPADDSYTGLAGLVSIGLHYQADEVGSKNMSSKI